MDPGDDQGMERKDEAKEALPDIFGIQVILNKILDHLPNSKLFELSFVNKFWKKEARNVMRKRGNVTAVLKSTRGCGEVFQEFVENLQTLNETLYSGMTIWLQSVVRCCEVRALVVEAIHESILAGLRGQLKRLSIRLDYPHNCWPHARNCPNFLLLRLLLTDFIGELEHLTLEILRENMEQFTQQFLPHGPYPRLKVLKLKSYTETLTNLIRTLISQAPNVQEIHTYGPVCLWENLTEGREGVVHVHESYVGDPMQDILENVMPELRLKSIKLYYNRKPQLELDRFNEKAQRLLRICCATTLEELELEELSLVLLMSYGIQLVNVKRLRIRLDYFELELFEPRIMSLLSNFDFTYLFPNLKEVAIHMLLNKHILGGWSRDAVDAIIEQANAVQKEPTLPRARNIKFLELSYQEPIPTCALQFLARMFPALQEIKISPPNDIQVGSVWEIFPDLRLINVKREMYRRP